MTAITHCEIDDHTRELFETVAPDGSTFEGFVGSGTKLVFPSHQSSGAFLLEVHALASFARSAGWLPAHVLRSDIDRISARGLVHDWAVPGLDDEGGLELHYSLVDERGVIRADQHTPGAIPVTIYEF